jgi:VIT1/CCC1 family predicted Fe2+/Mn2+ transporter
MLQKFTKEELIAFFRNFVFGVEDSLVSTVGLLSGVAAAGEERHTIIVAGVVLIFVEAFSMGVGSLLSDNSVRELTSGKEEPLARSYGSSLVMFVSYFITGFIPLAPYVFLSNSVAFYTSIACSLLALFALGFTAGKFAKISPLREGIQMMLLGGAAISLGVVVGTIINGG